MKKTLNLQLLFVALFLLLFSGNTQAQMSVFEYVDIKLGRDTRPRTSYENRMVYLYDWLFDELNEVPIRGQETAQIRIDRMARLGYNVTENTFRSSWTRSKWEDGVLALFVDGVTEAERLKTTVDKDRQRQKLEAQRRKEAQEKAEQEKIQRERQRQEQERERERQRLETNYQNDINAAEAHLNNREYALAKTSFQRALQLKPENDHVINPEIKAIDYMLNFLSERQYKTYNYTDFFSVEFQNTNTRLENEIRKILQFEKNINLAAITIVSIVDTSGIVKTTMESNILDQALNQKIQQIANTIKLNQPVMNGYTVSAKAMFKFLVNANNTIVGVEKGASGFHTNSHIGTKLSSAPVGRFTLQLNEVTINGKGSTESKILNYNFPNDGPSNAFLSLLVPGLGRHRVTHGEQKGIFRAFYTYSFIGAGVLYKHLSNQDLVKYRAATKQEDMDRYFENAKFKNDAFYVLVGLGVLNWISDIIFVWSRGVKNKEQQNIWRHSNMSFYHTPESNAIGLTYTLNF